MNDIDLKQTQPLEVLREKFTGDAEQITRRTAKDIFIGGLKGFLVIFGSIFGAIITSDAVQINLIMALLLFGFISLSGLFLYFSRKDKTVIHQLRRDQLIMAKTQNTIVDTMETDFKIRLDTAMTNIEQLYGDTILGLTNQINDLIREMCEERDKLHTLITVMTTDYSNGADFMTTED
jgi:hypothetical protein